MFISNSTSRWLLRSLLRRDISQLRQLLSWRVAPQQVSIVIERHTRTDSHISHVSLLRPRFFDSKEALLSRGRCQAQTAERQRILGAYLRFLCNPGRRPRHHFARGFRTGPPRYICLRKLAAGQIRQFDRGCARRGGQVRKCLGPLAHTTEDIDARHFTRGCGSVQDGKKKDHLSIIPTSYWSCIANAAKSCPPRSRSSSRSPR